MDTNSKQAEAGGFVCYAWAEYREGRDVVAGSCQMALYGWPDCPAPVRTQVAGLVEHVTDLMGAALAGVYLHGSLAYGCFNPASSNLDLLVLSSRPLLRDTKLGVAQSCLRRSLQPAPVELRVLAPSDLVPWQYPTPSQFHFSEQWRERLTAETTTTAWLRWPAGQQGTDPDLAAHVTLTRARGIALVGKSPAAVFPDVPAADYLASITADSEAALTQPLTNPVATVLNLCRVAWYLRAQVLSSKEEAGVWAQEAVRAAHKELVSQALAVYRGSSEPVVWEAEPMRRFGHQVLAAATTGQTEELRGPARQLSLGDH
ncbi:MAG TPA: aminoglycoside adenylyltransferase domain-containing protein [Ktedonobacterales bacterium]|nr:aminoglycoside adenylyltransferase domain-containing protein [Ktedonobacterales bacterium]